MDLGGQRSYAVASIRQHTSPKDSDVLSSRRHCLMHQITATAAALGAWCGAEGSTIWRTAPQARRERPPQVPLPPSHAALSTRSAAVWQRMVMLPEAAAGARKARAASRFPPAAQPWEQCFSHAAGVSQFCGMTSTWLPSACTHPHTHRSADAASSPCVSWSIAGDPGHACMRGG